MTRFAGTLLCVGIAIAMLSGCTSRGERLYRRAETFLAQGQFKMAAEEYRRIVVEEATDALADDALYKLAYVLAEEMDRPTVALVQYRALADNYPNSPWVDDALMRIMRIQREVLGDPEAVRRTSDELSARFGDRADLCARGVLEVARAHFAAEDYSSAAETADELIMRFPQQRTQCAQAALLHVRARERTGAEQAEVEKLYESVIERYPDTHAAAMAKRNIGWIFYGKREELEQRQAQEIEAQSRTIVGVPAHTAPQARLPQALAALRASLAHRGERRSMEWLQALVGLPFAIVFDPDRPTMSPEPIDDSPFEVVSETLGFAPNTISGTGAESAFATLHQALLQGHPVIIRYGSQAHWTIVTGYDRKNETVYFMPPGRDGYARARREQFLAAWSSGSGTGSGIAGPQPFHQFSLGARFAEPSEEDLLRFIVERAADVMARHTLQSASAGASAWEAVSTWLEMCVQPDEPRLRQTAARWVDGSLRPYLARAEAVTPLLREAEEQLLTPQGTTERHEELCSEAAVVARKVSEAVASEEESENKWKAAAAQADYVAALHDRLAEQLGSAPGDTTGEQQPEPADQSDE